MLPAHGVFHRRRAAVASLRGDVTRLRRGIPQGSVVIASAGVFGALGHGLRSKLASCLALGAALLALRSGCFVYPPKRHVGTTVRGQVSVRGCLIPVRSTLIRLGGPLIAL